MKMVNAVVPPHTLDDVRRALERHAVLGMTISEVHGCGRHPDGPVQLHRGVAVQVPWSPFVRVEAIVHDELVERVLTDISGNVGVGGKLWVVPLDLVQRVRTGERGEDAI